MQATTFNMQTHQIHELRAQSCRDRTEIERLRTALHVANCYAREIERSAKNLQSNQQVKYDELLLELDEAREERACVNLDLQKSRTETEFARKNVRRVTDSFESSERLVEILKRREQTLANKLRESTEVYGITCRVLSQQSTDLDDLKICFKIGERANAKQASEIGRYKGLLAKRRFQILELAVENRKLKGTP